MEKERQLSFVDNPPKNYYFSKETFSSLKRAVDNNDENSYGGYKWIENGKSKVGIILTVKQERENVENIFVGKVNENLQVENKIMFISYDLKENNYRLFRINIKRKNPEGSRSLLFNPDKALVEQTMHDSEHITPQGVIFKSRQEETKDYWNVYRLLTDLTMLLPANLAQYRDFSYEEIDEQEFWQFYKGMTSKSS